MEPHALPLHPTSKFTIEIDGQKAALGILRANQHATTLNINAVVDVDIPL
jgi:hypothetical protein